MPDDKLLCLKMPTEKGRSLLPNCPGALKWEEDDHKKIYRFKESTDLVS